MRIRTIKPEFWTHPVLTKIPDFSRLLAIALLNLADDEGFFDADEVLIRGTLFPREESTKVRRSLDDLSRIGYIEVRETAERGPIGKITNFSKHQRIDRAKPSQISDLWESTTNRRLIDDKSTQERKGKERKGKSTDTDVSVVNAPSSPSPEPCPFEKILNLYHENCPSLPRIHVQTDGRRQAVKSRWVQYKRDLRAFEILFQKAEASDFLSGRSGRWKGANFDWLLKQSNMAKVLEKNYDNAPPETRHVNGHNHAEGTVNYVR